MNKITVKGKLKFEPPNVTKKHSAQADWKYTAILLLDDDTAAYYRWFIKRRFNLKLETPLRGSHVTFINDRLSDSNANLEEIPKMFDGKEVSITYDISYIRTNSRHWWLRIESDELLAIREICGFSREPYFGLHLTIGIVNDLNYAHSEYIHKIIVKYGL